MQQGYALRLRRLATDGEEPSAPLPGTVPPALASEASAATPEAQADAEPALAAADAPPGPEGPGGPMQPAAPPPLHLPALNDILAKEDIDYRSLRAQLRALLAERQQVSIGELLARYPAEQGLGSLLGLLALGKRHGVWAHDETETVGWQGQDSQPQQVQIPKILFTRERLAAGGPA